jgi:heterodisulfide reductase subunit C
LSNNKQRKTISVKDLNPEFKHEVAKRRGGEHIRRCFACGTCTAGCPVRALNDDYNPRRIIHQVLLGMKDEVLKNDFIWLCSTCYTCQERCPQGVRIADIMTVLKNMAVDEGRVPPAYAQQGDLICKHGRLYEIDEFDNRKREKAGLPPIPTTCDDVAKIFKATGLDKKLGGKGEESK